MVGMDVWDVQRIPACKTNHLQSVNLPYIPEARVLEPTVSPVPGPSILCVNPTAPHQETTNRDRDRENHVTFQDQHLQLERDQDIKNFEVLENMEGLILSHAVQDI